LACNLANPYLNCKPKARVTTTVKLGDIKSVNDGLVVGGKIKKLIG